MNAVQEVKNDRGEFVTIPGTDNGSLRCYLSLPPSGAGPGLVILPDGHGINAWARANADYFAEEGYSVLMPEMTGRSAPGAELGYSAQETAEAIARARDIDTELAVSDVSAAVADLAARDECQGKIGLVGYGIGGKLALLAAARCDVVVAVAYYPLDIDQVILEAAVGVVAKSIFSAFASNDLHDQLRARDITDLILAGVATDIVVECTSWAAADLGYNLLVASDCCCSHTMESHESSLERISARADIVPSAQLIGALG